MTSSLHSQLAGFSNQHARTSSSEPPTTGLPLSGVHGAGIAGMGMVGHHAVGHGGMTGLDALRSRMGQDHALNVPLSDEQRAVIDAALAGRDVIVDATIGSGKTKTIQHLCNELNAARPNERILYLTYSRLLKDDARQRVTGAKVQNYHGVVYPALLAAGIKCGLNESVAQFNKNFDSKISAMFDVYDVLVIDEYQDITEEYAELLWNIKSKNPVMQVIMVGDMEQRVSAASRHNAQEFAQKFCDNPLALSFTQSFRMGPEMAGKLAQAWNKPINGANTSQVVELMSFDDAVAEMLNMSARPGDILCLGKRNGEMTNALNIIEQRAPQAFNKNTVYASVKDKGSQVSFTPNSAIFTTFDASKGLERDTCFIFDYLPQNFKSRLSFKDANPEVLRNVFLVAASRGKSRIIFVNTSKNSINMLHDQAIGGIPIRTFTNLPETERPQYIDGIFNTADMFDFKYVETVTDAFNLLDRELIEVPPSEPFEIESSDGLIDLVSVINQYQKIMYFDNYRTNDAVKAYSDHQSQALAVHMARARKKAATQRSLVTAWDEALALTAAITNYDRYVNQVSVAVSHQTTEMLRRRLDKMVSPSDKVQTYVQLGGTALHSRVETSPIMFAGTIDVVRDDAIIQLHYVSELDHTHFLEAGMLSILAGKDKAVLWNTRTNERWIVRVPDEQRFLDAVTFCVTKQNYRQFRGH